MLLWASSFFKDICSFTSFWLCWVFIAVLGFPLAAASGARSLAVEHGLLTVVLLLLRSMGSRALERQYLWNVGSVIAAPN